MSEIVQLVKDTITGLRNRADGMVRNAPVNSSQQANLAQGIRMACNKIEKEVARLLDVRAHNEHKDSPYPHKLGCARCRGTQTCSGCGQRFVKKHSLCEHGRCVDCHLLSCSHPHPPELSS